MGRYSYETKIVRYYIFSPLGKMGATCSKVKGEDASNPFLAKNRKCTDLCCLIFFAMFWCGMLAIAGIGLANGQPEKLVFGVDWKGRTCGAKSDANGDVPAYDLREYKKMIYPRLGEDLYELQFSGASFKDPKVLKKLFGVCVRDCPNPLNENKTQLYTHAYIDYDKHPEPVNGDTQSQGKEVENEAAGSPWMVALNTSDVLYRCLDLGNINATAYVRCVDPCRGGNTTNCGEDEVANPFKRCGPRGCQTYVDKNFPKCRTTRTREVVNKKGAAKSSPIYNQLNSKWKLVGRWIGDLEKSALPILICGGMVAIVLGFMWLFMLKYCAGFFVWLSITLLLVMMFTSTLYLCYKGEVIDPSRVNNAVARAGFSPERAEDINTYFDEAGFARAEDKVKFWAIAAYIFMVADAIILLLLAFLCSRIKIAIGIIREASKAVQAMPFLILFPLLPTLWIVTLIIYWLVTAAYIASSGKIDVETVRATYDADNSTAEKYGLAEYSDNNLMNYMLFYHLFGLLWTNQFFQALGYMTIAGAVVEYYWTLDKKSIQKLPIFRSFYRSVRYHLGSIAFGSLIIAVIQAVRLVLEYIDSKTKQAQEGNALVKVAMACCKCFLWVFEQCIKFLNINAYIMVAMKGTSFVTSMKDAFQLLIANAARVATVGIISTFLLLLGKLFIVAFSTFCMFLFIRKPPANLPSFMHGDIEEVSSPLFPMFITALLAYAIASFFLGVYETAIDTILLCFCEDCKVNKATGTYYMSDELLSYVDGAAKKNAFRHFKGKTDSTV